MGGQMDEWGYDWVGGWLDDGWMNGWRCEQVGRQMTRWRMGGQMDGWMGRCMGGWVDRQMGKNIGGWIVNGVAGVCYLSSWRT